MSYITDVAVTRTSDSNPVSPSGSGWNCVKNKDGKNQDFNRGAGGDSDYVWVWYQSSSGA